MGAHLRRLSRIQRPATRSAALAVVVLPALLLASTLMAEPIRPGVPLPGLDSPRAEVRLKAAKTLTDQATLARLATEDPNADVRRTAIRQITDQATLARIACDSTDREVGSHAARHVNPSDQVSLAAIARGGRTLEARVMAIRKLTDQAVLGELAWGDADPRVREASIPHLSDQVLLARIAVEDPVLGNRKAAAAAMTDQIALARIAVEASDVPTRCQAIGRLEDQALLARLAAADGNPEVRSAAVERLTDESRLEEVATRALLIDTRLEAVRRISDQELLARLAIGSEWPGVRQAAFGCIKEQKRLAQIARLSSDRAMVLDAVRAIRDEGLIRQVAEAYRGRPDSDEVLHTIEQCGEHLGRKAADTARDLPAGEGRAPGGAGRRGERSIDDILRDLRSRNRDTRMKAIAEAGRQVDPRALEPLVDLATTYARKGPSKEFRGDPSGPRMVMTWQDSLEMTQNRDERMAAVSALGAMALPEAFPAVEKLFEAEDEPIVLSVIATAMARTNPVKAGESFARASAAKKDTVRLKAIFAALEWLPFGAATGTYATLLRDGGLADREAGQLGRLMAAAAVKERRAAPSPGDGSLLDAVMDVLPGAGPCTRAALCAAVLRLGWSVDFKKEAVKRRVDLFSGEYVFSLMEGDPRSLPMLEEALGNEGDEMMAAVFKQSGNSRLEKAAQAWLKDNEIVLPGNPVAKDGCSIYWGSR